MNDLVSEFESRKESWQWMPEELLREYSPLECLADNSGCTTLLVRNRSSGELYVAKCYNVGGALIKTTEGEILRKLHHDGLPEFTAQYDSSHTVCIVRRYIEGRPLSEMIAERTFTENEVRKFGIRICDTLKYLHSQKPPIIHRDLKPKNIIVGDDGEISIIDFGISRMVSGRDKTDTICAATADYAPPEQFGFLPSTVRSDIYSLGAVLNEMLTGSPKTDRKDHSGGLRRVIRKCTKFSPKERYANVDRLSHALRRLKHRKARIIAAIAAACLLLSAVTCRVLVNIGLSEKEERMERTAMQQDVDRRYFDSHMYQLYISQTVSSWREAEELCEKKGGHLATISSEEENDFLYSIVRKKARNRAHFGLYYYAAEKEWRWITGEELTYTNWGVIDGRAEPTYDYLTIDGGMFYADLFGDGKWNDGDYSETNAFLCEWDSIPETEVSALERFADAVMRIFGADE